MTDLQGNIYDEAASKQYAGVLGVVAVEKECLKKDCVETESNSKHGSFLREL